MPQNAYLYVTGVNQGEIKGDVIKTGKEDSIRVYAHEHIVEIPTDLQNGQPVGERFHKPLRILKAKDVSTPKLFQANFTGEKLPEVELKLFRITDGKEEHYFSIKLENAIIVKIREWSESSLLPNNEPDMEEIFFSFQKITWLYLPENIETYDDFNETF
ncbi:MAG: type VI secretion system tube protein Hcp [Candidatus Cloacimonetes bacterium]|nr:type VI secretion system tube protein Hcp [Candidatus Cloacimonadota bacterium]